LFGSKERRSVFRTVGEAEQKKERRVVGEEWGG
jgi:hypothetical protein